MLGGQDIANITSTGSLAALLDGGTDVDDLNLNDNSNILNLSADLSGTIQADAGNAPLTAIAGFETIRLAGGSDTANINFDLNPSPDSTPRQALRLMG